MVDILKKRGNLLLFIVAIVLTCIGVLKLIDYVVFITTKRGAIATVVKVELTHAPKPYKVSLVYLNRYVNDNVVTYIDNIGDVYGKRYLEVHNRLPIYYRNYFPREVYLKHYKYPTWGYAAFNMIYIIVMVIIANYAAKRKNLPVTWL
ncbi:hypothetical protein FFF34_007575 [Inquilinus sp. KBS0705]|nr:hypothetical protein FFF34_007575 [Inquilinus sp. KBS0705]